MTAPAYYRIDDLTRDHMPVVLNWWGRDVVGFRRTARTVQRVMWAAWVNGREETRQAWRRVAYITRHPDGAKEFIAPHAYAGMVWRPIRLDRWPDPLPEPVTMTREVAWQSPAPLPSEEVEVSLDWPRRYKEAPDISLEEAQVRVIRALRTMWSRETRVEAKADRIGWGKDSVIRVSGGIWIPEYQDPTHVGAVMVPWKPTRVDAGDWVIGVGWWSRLGRSDQDIVALRAANPPYSFFRIGERLKCSGLEARARYELAIDRVGINANWGGE